MRSLVLAAGLAALSLAACVDADVPTGEDGIGDLDEVVVDDKADTTEIRARIDGLTVWIDRAVVLGNDGSRRFSLGGRTSRNLTRLDTTGRDAPAGEGRVRSARTFELQLDDAELGRVLAGAPLFVTVTTSTGAPATAAVWLEPRTVRTSGTSRVYLSTKLTATAAGGDTVYRSRATVESSWGNLRATGPAGATAAVAVEDATHWRADWSLTSVLAAFTSGGAPLSYAVTKGNQVATRLAGVELVVSRLALTRRNPHDVWGATPSLARAADDFRAHLVAYYADHGADITSAGGNTLAQAQAAVDAGAFTAVTDIEEDPFAHDPATHWILRHPDVTHPGSDIAWFVVYRRSDGALVEIYDFN